MHTKNFSYKSTLLGFVSDPFSHSERKVNSEGERDIYIYNNDEDVFLSISELKSARSFLRISCDQNRSLRGSRRVAKEARGPHPFLLPPRLPSRSPGRNSDSLVEKLSTVLCPIVLDGIGGSKFQGVPQASSAGERNRDRRKGERRCRRERRQPRDGQRMRRRVEEAQSSQMRRGRLRQGVHQELPPQGSQEDPHR